MSIISSLACNCSGNGVCNDGVDGDGSCSCLPGWQGDNCDICKIPFYTVLCVESVHYIYIYIYQW